MPDFHRYYLPNAINFITTVTHDRIPYLESDGDIKLFWETLKVVQTLHPFHLMAYVIMPDHFHWLMTLPEDKPNFSEVIHSIKRNFVINYKKAHKIHTPTKIFQSRFWDHVIRSETDLRNHIDYIHWNPVKHGYSPTVDIWQHSSYSFWEARGYYAADWGSSGEPEYLTKMNYD
jgi:putative transposase